VVEAHRGRVRLDFSPGAVSEETHIRVSPLSNIGVPGMVAPTAFDFGPDGTAFAAPVTLTLGYNQSEIPDGVEETELVMLASSHDSAEVVPVEGSTVDPVANTISATISGFSVHGMGLPGCTFAGGPLPWCPPKCELPAPPSPDDPGGDIDTTFGTDGTFRFELDLASSTDMKDLLIDDQGRISRHPRLPSSDSCFVGDFAGAVRAGNASDLPSEGTGVVEERSELEALEELTGGMTNGRGREAMCRAGVLAVTVGRDELACGELAGS
jgi:hypothetical protein